jgi:hypothetical protein
MASPCWATTRPPNAPCVVSPKAAGQGVAEYGITVNAHCPGIVGTAMWDLIDEELAKHMGLHKGEALKQYSELIALGRVEEPEDTAAFVSYLASRDSDSPVDHHRLAGHVSSSRRGRRRNALTLVSLVIIVSSPTRRDGKEAP